jgi:hypothetical protein
VEQGRGRAHLQRGGRRGLAKGRRRIRMTTTFDFVVAGPPGDGHGFIIIRFSLRRQDPVGFSQPTDMASFFAYGQRHES